MKRFLPAVSLLVHLASHSHAKPPLKAPQEPPVSAARSPSPSSPSAGSASWLRWLLEQDGGTAAITAPALEVLHAVSNQPIVALKPTDPIDSGVTARIGGALDSLLPKLNRPDGAVRLAAQSEFVAPFIDQELRELLAGLPGTECAPTATEGESILGNARPMTYPSLRLTDSASHRVYYLGVAFVSTSQSDGTAPLLQIDPISAAKRLSTPGTPLLVVLEHNGKSGKELAFLNWQLVDLQAARTRLRVSFSATAEGLALPGSAINDGRKGRD